MFLLGWFDAGFAFTPDASLLYMSSMFSNQIDILNTRTNQLEEGAISLPSNDIINILFSPSADKLYALTLEGTLYVVNMQTRQVVGELDIGTQTRAFARNADGTKLYIPARQKNTISVVSTEQLQVIKTIVVDDGPDFFQKSSDGTQLYVGNALSNTVSVIDMLTDNVIKTITIHSVQHRPNVKQ